MALFPRKPDRDALRRTLDLGATYDTPCGRRVLAERLISSGVFSTIDAADAEAVPRHNMAVRELYDMGVLNDGNIEKVVDFLLSLRYKE